jgi:SAM-dependent methyltransferase
MTGRSRPESPARHSQPTRAPGRGSLHSAPVALLREALPKPVLQTLVRTRPLLYRGDAVRCPCCNRTFRSFLTHRGVANVRCPSCGSMERHRLLTLWWRAHPEFLAGVRRILHLAPETPLTRYLSNLPGVEYLTADLDSPLAAIHCDIQDLPLRDGFFDLVVCNHVLEHIPDDRLAMRELHRVLSPGGRAIVMCPVARDRDTTLEDATVTTREQRLAVYGQEDHVRLYGADYGDRLREAGFTLVIDRFLASLDDATLERHALRRRHDLFEADDIYVAHKPS